MATQPPNVAIVSIDFQVYVLPVPKATQLMAIMQHARACDRNFDGSSNAKYIAHGEHREISMEIVRSDQVTINGKKRRTLAEAAERADET
jgi:hypothetical protein